MNERFKQIRLSLGLSQSEFGNMLGLSRSGVSEIESGRRNVTEQHILHLKYNNISEKWIRTGEGSMFVESTQDEEIATLVGQLLSDESESFKKDVIHSLLSMNDKGWKLLEEFLIEYNKANKKE